jgi:hypothetical protein
MKPERSLLESLEVMCHVEPKTGDRSMGYMAREL